MLGPWELIAVLATANSEHPWIVRGVGVALGFLVSYGLLSREYFDRIPTLEVHLDSGTICKQNAI